MKLLYTFLALATLSAAQDFRGVPKCAIPCLKEDIPKVGCDITDTSCQCSSKKQSQLVGIITPCLLDNCGTSDLLKAQSAASSNCAEFSKTASQMSAISTATMTGTDTTGLVVATGSASSTSSSSSSSHHSSTSSTTGTASPDTTASAATTSAPSSTSGSTTASGTGSATTSTTSGAAVGGPVVGAAAALLAMLAL